MFTRQGKEGEHVKCEARRTRQVPLRRSGEACSQDDGLTGMTVRMFERQCRERH